MTQSIFTIAYGFAFGVNLIAVGRDLAAAQYGSAGVQSLLLIVILAFQYFAPKLDALLDAQIATHLAQRDTAQHMLAAIESHQAEVHVEVSTGKVRAH